MEKPFKRSENNITKLRHEKELNEILGEIRQSVISHMKNYNFEHQDNRIDMQDVCQYLKENEKIIK